MQVRLIVRTTRNRRVLTINRPVAVVGRAKGCSVRIPENDVSRRHCRIRQVNGFVVIEDLRSLNGTYVNGERISGARAVRPGDAVEVGPLRFIVGYELSPDSREKLEAFETDVELLPEDSGPDFLEDVDGIEWVDEPDDHDMAPGPGGHRPPESGDQATEYQTQKRMPLVDESWVLPTDVQLPDLLEPLDEDDAKH